MNRIAVIKPSPVMKHIIEIMTNTVKGINSEKLSPTNKFTNTRANRPKIKLTALEIELETANISGLTYTFCKIPTPPAIESAACRNPCEKKVIRSTPAKT
jgi:hypothetical protein